MDSESARDEEFLYYLGRIEFQAAIIADNPSNLNSGSMRNLAAEKSLALLTASVKFLNKALIHFSRNFPGATHALVFGLNRQGTLRILLSRVLRLTMTLETKSTMPFVITIKQFCTWPLVLWQVLTPTHFQN